MPDNYLLEMARRHFAKLKEGRVSILGADDKPSLEQLLLEFNSAMYLTKSTMADLDPTGKKSAAEMQKEFDAAVSQCKIIEARELFSTYLPSGKPYLAVDEAVETIDGYLKEAGKDYAALDPTGKASAKEMRAQLNHTVAHARLSVAQQAWAELQANTGDVDNALKAIHAPGITLAMLMPDLKTEAERKKQLDTAAKKGYYRQAQEVLKNVAGGYIDDATDYLPASMGLIDLHENLTKAGMNPTSMDAEMPAAAKAGALARAQSDFLNLPKGSNPDQDIGSIMDALKEAGAPITALDPTGKASAQEIQQQIDIAVRPGHLAQAKGYYRDFVRGMMRGDIPNLAAELDLIHTELKKAGVDAAALDPDHQKSAAEMEALLTQRLHDFGLTPSMQKSPVDPSEIKQR